MSYLIQSLSSDQKLISKFYENVARLPSEITNTILYSSAATEI